MPFNIFLWKRTSQWWCLEKCFCFFRNKIASINFWWDFPKYFLVLFLGTLNSKQIALAFLFSFPLRIKTSLCKNITDDSVFFYGSGIYRKHPNHTYGKNRNNSANNWALISLCEMVWKNFYAAYLSSDPHAMSDWLIFLNSFKISHVKATNRYRFRLRPEICVKYFLSFPRKNLSPEKVFIFLFWSDKIDQNTNFVKFPRITWLFMVKV